MTLSLSGQRVMVVGGGAFGLTTAVFAAREGAKVTLHTADPLDASASAVAAGMLSPIFETLEAGGDFSRFELLHAGLKAWDRSGLPTPDPSGALHIGEDAEALAQTLRDWNAPGELITAAAARSLHPDLPLSRQPALFTPLEARLTPLRWLRASQATLREAGGRIDPEAVLPSDLQAWRRRADAVVIAAGYASRDWRDAARALDHLSPIKGHILHFQAGTNAGPTLRSGEGYIAPQPDGALFGASMQNGYADLTLEPAVVRDLHVRAVALAPSLAEAPFIARTGVRAATPDGLPLAGRLEDGLFTATGARRNGWLLAPLVAETVVAALAGRRARYADAFDPARFDRAA